ncbi:DUF551 domain-containing protein [Escherichia coli]|nr:DUF551 domain-containing protein [Escherichia coli]
MNTITKEWLQNTITGIESIIDDKSFVCSEIAFEIGQVNNILTAFKIALASLAAVSDERAAYELFMEKRFGESVDRRRAKNGDREYMAWDMALGWIIWCHRAAMLQSGNFLEIAETSTNSPVIPSEVLSAILKFARVRADFDDFDGDRRGIGDCLDEAEQELIVTINKYASYLAVKPVVPVGLDERAAFNSWNNDEDLPIAGVGAKNAAWLAWQARAELGRSLVVNSPVTPDSWISCSERMPNDAQWCVVNTKYGYYVQCWSEGQGWLGDDISIPECDVINWMPLPEPPQEVK